MTLWKRYPWGPALLLFAAGTPATAQWGANETTSDTIGLERAIALALTHNHELAQAAAALHGAGGRVREAWASVLPDLRSSASYQRNFRVQEAFLPAIFFDPDADPEEVVPVRFGADNSWQAGLTLSQPLFEVSAFIGVGAAARFRALEEERVRGVAQNVVTGVRRAYFDVLLAAEQVRLTAQSVERVRQTLAETRALHRAGLASEYDVLRVEVQLGNLEPNLQRARDARQAAARRLATVMGLAPDAAFAVEGRLHEVNVEDPARNAPANVALLRLAGAAAPGPAGYDSLYAAALGRRTDVRQARLAIELEEARYAAERAEFFPKLTVFGNYSVFAQQNDPLNFFGTERNRSTSFHGGVRVELPIFTGFARSARMQQARANVRQQTERLALVEKQTADQVRTLLDVLAETRRRVASQGHAVAQARRGFEIASAEYRAGVGSQLQITDAEVALRQSEFNYAQAVYDHLLARADLDAALGTAPVAGGMGANGAERAHE